MSVAVSIPTPLRNLTQNADTVTVEAGTIEELVTALDAAYPGMKDRLVDGDGNLRRFVNFYLNGEDVRFLDDKQTALKPGDEVSIVPAIAGG
ncbi:MAG: MoaD/ThiS family protein [Verrucomicrobiia bacterium]